MARGQVLAAVFACLLMCGIEAAGQSFPRLEGPYLGQKPPGLKPQPFAPGIVTTDGEEGGVGFARRGTVLIFQRFIDGRCQTYLMRQKDGAWTAPALIPFWEAMADNGDFVISSDDKTMLYQVRSRTESGPISHIWRAEVTDTDWGERMPLPPPVNTRYFESFASDTSGGMLYFFSRRPGGKGGFDLYKSAFMAGTYSEPVNLAPLNTEYDEWDPFVAPDESYLIFCSTKPGGLGRDDLYVSFKGKDGSWSAPVNLGEEINSAGSENRPSVTRDGRYFFFTSTRDGSRDVFWVEASYLDRFRK
jgi:WD40-like Beta Propeller Repeat